MNRRTFYKNSTGSVQILLPQQFLLLCRLMEQTPKTLLQDFAQNLSCGSWKREGRDEAKTHLLNYFIAHGYGRHLYTHAEIQQLFKEMDALGLLFPYNGNIQLVKQYAAWRTKHNRYWFKKWFEKPGRKLYKKRPLHRAAFVV